MKFIAKIKKGVICPELSPHFHDTLLGLEDKLVSIEIKELKKRSNPQNRYYWGVVVHMVAKRLIDLGYTRSDLIYGDMGSKLTREDVHEFLKQNFNTSEIVSPQGEVIGVTSVPTKDLPPGLFKEYIHTIIRWANLSLDIEIPDPEIIPELHGNN